MARMSHCLCERNGFDSRRNRQASGLCLLQSGDSWVRFPRCKLQARWEFSPVPVSFPKRHTVEGQGEFKSHRGFHLPVQAQSSKLMALDGSTEVRILPGRPRLIVEKGAGK